MKNIQQKKNLKKVPFSPSSLASSNSPLLDSPLKEETPKVVKEQNQMILTAEALGLPDIFSPLKIELNLNDFELTNTILDDSSDFPTPTELFPTTPNFQNSNLNTSQNQLLQSPLTPKTPAWDQNLFDFINFYA